MTQYQINQAVLFEFDCPYIYELGKVVFMDKNQDQITQYSVKLYKKTNQSQHFVLPAFKIKTITVKQFNILKERSKQFNDLAQSLISLYSELKDNLTFINNHQNSQKWIKLLKKSSYYFQDHLSRRSPRFRKSNLQAVSYKTSQDYNFLKNQKIDPKLVCVHYQKSNNKYKRKLYNYKTNIKYEAKNQTYSEVQNKLKQVCKNKQKKEGDILQIPYLKQKKHRKCSLKKKHNKLNASNSKYRVAQMQQKKRLERYYKLYLFCLHQIEQKQIIQKCQSNILKISKSYINDFSEQSVQNLRKSLETLKNYIFCKQLNRQSFISQQQTKGYILKVFNTLQQLEYNIVPQLVMQEIILIIKIFYLKEVDQLKQFVKSLLLWTKKSLQNIKLAKQTLVGFSAFKYEKHLSFLGEIESQKWQK